MTKQTTKRLALVGAGLMGAQHAEAIAAAEGADLVAVADPSDAGHGLAGRFGVEAYGDLTALLRGTSVDGVVLATPNALHKEGALTCIGQRLPVLIEKPLATDAAEGREIAAAAEAAGTLVAVGHHRRHNPLIQKAKSVLDDGRLGMIASAHCTLWLAKPAEYFKAEWRTRKGAGPILINLIHEVDLLLHLCGPITEIMAFTAHNQRGFEVEDTATIMLRFASGALGTINVSDTISAPWSWELTARENPAYPPTDQDSLLLGGTKGSLAVPSLTLWTHGEEPHWWRPITAAALAVDEGASLVRQIENFVGAVRREVAPLATVEDGIAALAVIDGIRDSISSNRPVRLNPTPPQEYRSPGSHPPPNG